MRHISQTIRNMRDIDEGKGVVSFYFSDFGSVDSHGRKMSPTAFNRTIKNNFNRIQHLQNHDPNRIAGRILDLNTDSKGAYAVSKLSKSSTGADLKILYDEGIINEHSFAFRIINSHDENGIEIVDEAQIWEVSSVTWGANEHTPMISLNELSDMLKEDKMSQEVLEKLNEIASLLPAIKHQDSKESLDNLKHYINNFK